MSVERLRKIVNATFPNLPQVSLLDKRERSHLIAELTDILERKEDSSKVIRAYGLVYESILKTNPEAGGDKNVQDIAPGKFRNKQIIDDSQHSFPRCPSSRKAH